MREFVMEACVSEVPQVEAKAPSVGPWAVRGASGQWELGEQGKAEVAALTGKFQGRPYKMLKGGKYRWVLGVLGAKGWTDEDLTQASIVGLCISALYYRPGTPDAQGKEMTFDRFAYYSVVNELTRCARQYRTGFKHNNVPIPKTSSAVRLGQPIPGQNEIYEPEDVKGSEGLERDERNKAIREVLDDGLRLLDPRSREIVVRTFGLNGYDEITHREMRELLGNISITRVGQIRDKAIRKLRKRLIYRLKEVM